MYYRPRRKPPLLQERFVQPIKALIEREPSYGYRTVAHLLGFNKNTVQRVFQQRGWQVRKRPTGFRPRVEVKPSVAPAPDHRWATNLCRVWTGRDGRAVLALVIDCCTRELLGWHLSRSGKSKTAEAALEQALITRYGTLGRVAEPFLLRSDNGLVFTSRSYTALVRGYGLRQEFITPHTRNRTASANASSAPSKSSESTATASNPSSTQPASSATGSTSTITSGPTRPSP